MKNFGKALLKLAGLAALVGLLVAAIRRVTECSLALPGGHPMTETFEQ